MRHDLSWSIAPAPGPEHDRAVELLALLRDANPPMLWEPAVTRVLQRHIEAEDDPDGHALLAEILDEERPDA